MIRGQSGSPGDPPDATPGGSLDATPGGSPEATPGASPAASPGGSPAAGAREVATSSDALPLDAALAGGRSPRELPLADAQVLEPADLGALGHQLLQEATERPNGLRTRPVVRGPRLHAVLFALRAGSMLPEHDAPPAATLHVLRGEMRLVAQEDQWLLEAGQVLPIPPVRHWVEGLTDSVALLTVVR
ncbi:MAG TPA: cupin domain-containing protein [Ornithinicoccus sp.]|nr:cupin domain-containing protein [Ornithinicoccus sp.]